MARTYYIWDEVNDTLLMETDEAGNKIAEYTHEPGQFGPLISQRRNGQTRYYHYDGLGSTRALTDQSGNVTDTYVHDAWGNEVAHSGTTANPFRWVGQLGYYFDDGLGTFYIRARSYAPGVGRWISQDPQGFVDGLNLYGAYFVPNGVDPTGMWKKIDLSLYESDVCHESLRDLADLITGDTRDWVCIWPHGAGWGDYPCAAIGARARISNLLGLNSQQLKLVPATTKNDGYLAGVRLMLSHDQRGQLRTWSSGTGAAGIVKSVSGQGRTPVRWMVVGAHGGGGVELGNMAGGNRFSVSNLFDVADEKGNATNTLPHARNDIGPPRCWFTRDAHIYGLGCYSDEWANDWAAMVLRTPATAHGTTLFVFASTNPNRLWFSSTFPQDTPVTPAVNNLDEFFGLDRGWMQAGGSQ